MAINTQKWGPGFDRDDAAKWTTTHEGRVLAFQNVSVRVSSDHAMIDSGERVEVTIWDGTHVVRRHEYPDWEAIQVQVDAGPETLATVAEYNSVQSWFRKVLGGYYKLTRPVFLSRELGDFLDVGDRVDVVRGRKVPKGTYHVAHIGENDWGPFVHLQSEAGRLFRYVNRENLERAKPLDWELRNVLRDAGCTGGDFEDMAFTLLRDGPSLMAWLVLCDWLADRAGREAAGNHLRNLVHEKYETEEWKAYKWPEHRVTAAE